MQAMLATPADRPPAGPGWSHEVKWDGMRVLADVRGGRVRAATRTGTDATDRFPELAVLADVHPDVLLDGEVVDLQDGRPSFHRLAERIHARPGAAVRLARSRPITYLIFDILRLDGHDLCRLPLRDRRGLLESLEVPGPRALVPPVYPDGAALLRATREQGLEGVVSKRLDSGYEPGRRSPHWLKIPHRPTVSVVIGGWRPDATTGTGLGAVLVGRPTAQGWGYVGRVGAGIGPAQGALLLPRLRELSRDDCPFDVRPDPQDCAGTRWVDPVLVADVRSLGVAGHDPATGDRLRQSAYQGLRADLTADELRADLGAGDGAGDG